MGIDGLFLSKLKEEIEFGCKNTRVDKIHQPSKEELVILLRSFGVSKRLLICIKPSAPRVNFTGSNYENPGEPPMFCMLLRKHLSGARFIKIDDNGLERVATFVFEGTNEMGDTVTVKLIAELIGNKTNLILLGGDDRIIDSLRRSDIESGGRLIQPGARYEYPEKQSKVDLRTDLSDEVIQKICSVSLPLAKALVGVFDGVSPLVAREITVMAGIDFDKASNTLEIHETNKLKEAIIKVQDAYNNAKPIALLDQNGLPFEFSYFKITQYGASAKTAEYESFSELLEAVYFERDRRERIRALALDLIKLVNNLKVRVARKIEIRRMELKKCADGEMFRIFGELLKANLYAVQKGMPYVDVQNYYDPELKMVRIPLNVSISPAQNAQRYFKEYRKCCNASALLGGLIEESTKELVYIESVADELARVGSVAELKEIRDELIEAGYIKVSRSEKKRASNIKSKPLEFTSPDGYRVLVGRNNRQNDELTLKIADNSDMWFHTKNIPGSHVVVLSGGDELPESTIMFAALLAAKHSNAAESSSVPVDYTRIKYIKKPAGAKPGMVIYKTNKTVYVTPRKD